jgi:hypothetical protein
LTPAVDRNGRSWTHTGEFPETLSVTPSIDAGCWHGFITQGNITNA